MDEHTEPSRGEPAPAGPMRLVVTGASGNVGTALLRRLVDEGHEVTGVCRRVPPSVPPYDAVRWHRADLSECSAEDLVGVFRGADAVVHLAWGFQPTRDARYHHRLGIGGTAAVVEACRLAGVPHLVHQSSVGAYAPTDDGGPGVSVSTRVREDAPRGGVPTSVYNRDKTGAEEVLDRHAARHPGAPTIARMRPGFVLHAEAASDLVRYFTPAVVPTRLLRWLPVLPVDRRLSVPVVHGADMAEALLAAVRHGRDGAFNIAAEPPLTRDVMAAELGARPVQLPLPVLRALVRLSWALHLQPVSVGWLDLAYAVPLMDTTRAAEELGWHPRHGATEALHEVVDAIAAGRSGASAPLRRRTWRDALASLRRGGPVDVRRLP